MDKKIAVLIPAYNEKDHIVPLLEAIKKVGLDIILVDDGSEDGTAEIARRHVRHLLRHRRNEGKGKSVHDGFKIALEAGYDAVLLMDADGQHSPDDIAQFLTEYYRKDGDLIIGNRMHNPKGMSIVRVITNHLMSVLLSLIARRHVPDTQCGFRLLNRKTLQTIRLKSSRFEIESEIILQAAKNKLGISSVPIKSIYGDEKSKINPFVDTVRFIKFLFSR